MPDVIPDTPDEIVRIVSENSRSLKFEDAGFESNCGGRGPRGGEAAPWPSGAAQGAPSLEGLRRPTAPAGPAEGR